MIIIGVDFHPSMQEIAFLDQQTGEQAERELNHSEETRHARSVECTAICV
jgi:hypothetical protein